MFEKLIHSSLHNRLMVMVLAVLMLVTGAFTLVKMPVDVFPLSLIHISEPTRPY